MTASSGKARRTSPWAALAYVLALLMTLYAFAINVITFATNDYRSIVLQAVGLAGLAVLLVFVIWRRVPAAARIMLVLCVLANLFTLFDAGGRRLPELQVEPAAVQAIAAAHAYIRERGSDPLGAEWSARHMPDGTWSVMAWHIVYPNNSGSSRFVPGGHTFYTVSGDGKVLEVTEGR